jgi:hypothetical protein
LNGHVLLAKEQNPNAIKQVTKFYVYVKSQLQVQMRSLADAQVAVSAPCSIIGPLQQQQQQPCQPTQQHNQKCQQQVI